MVFASGSGGFLFNMAAGFLYKAQITDGSYYCYGSKCYRSVFVVTSLACLFALGIAIYVTHKTWEQVGIARKLAAENLISTELEEKDGNTESIKTGHDGDDELLIEEKK